MGHKILVIEDDPDMLSFLNILLHETGFEVLPANSATYGLKLAQADRPDLVLLDVMMPDVDGWETCRRLREIGDMPIVFVTALRDAKNRDRGLSMGDDYIVKPFDPRELISRVRSHIERWAAKNEPPGGALSS